MDNFPMGPLLNGDTHIFDGSVFTNNSGQRCFTMVALPKDIVDSITHASLEKWGSVHRLERLDTIEHMLFRHYTNQANNASDENVWIVFPQDAGYRVLYIANGLPQSAHYISNNPDMREVELDRVWQATTPQSVVILTPPHGKPENPDADRGIAWLEAFIQGRGDVAINHEELKPMSHYGHKPKKGILSKFKLLQ